MKKDKIIYWTTTGIIFLLEGDMTALTSHTQMAKDGVTHLGYPLYFLTLLAAFKVVGALALVYPKTPQYVREWAYAGFGIVFISAFVSHIAVDGFTGAVMFPLVMFAILATSYIYSKKVY